MRRWRRDFLYRTVCAALGLMTTTACPPPVVEPPPPATVDECELDLNFDTTGAEVLGADVDSVDEILDRLRRIDGVTVTEVRGGVGNIVFPALRLPEVTRVLVPLDSARAPEALVVAAYRGRFW